MIQEQIAALVDGKDLSEAQTEAAVEAILTGEATAAQIAGFLVALRVRGETPEQVAAAARVMRRHAIAVKVDTKEPLLDTCGTGGDGSNTFNISTFASIVVAACGVKVAKHGNRAASSRCGSADVLEALGINLNLAPELIAQCIERVGIGFMFARAHHPAMRHAGPVRAELGVRTLFNLLGPLSNPAAATHQLLGVGNPVVLELMAQVLSRLPIKHAWVVAGAPALDEVSLAGPTKGYDVTPGQVSEFSLTPADFGLDEAPLSALVGGDAEDNAKIASSIFAGEQGPRRDAVVINAASALCVTNTATSPREGAQLAAAAIDDGRAAKKLADWVAFSKAHA